MDVITISEKETVGSKESKEGYRGGFGCKEERNDIITLNILKRK